jgi:outer membrane protein
VTAVAVLLQAAPTIVLTLADAVRTAEANQPQLKLARANTEAAVARAGEARSYVLPQLVGTALYQRATSNFAPRPALLPNQVNMAMAAPPSLTSFDYWAFGITLSQYLWDFRAPFAVGATRAAAEAQRIGERSVDQNVRLSARSAFFTAQAQKALWGVAQHNLQDQSRHLEQSRAFVTEGVRPSIDAAQSETNYATAEVQLINAENAYQVSKVLLNQAMGVEGPADFDISDELLPAVSGEDSALQLLLGEAMGARPDLLGLERQLRAQRLTVSGVIGGYGPSFSAAASLTDNGPQLGALVWNWSVTINAAWTLFDGLYTASQVKEAKAGLHGLEAQRDALRQQVVVDVTQGQLQVRAAKASVAAADKGLVSARLQLELAEGRYGEGLGNVIELTDAQLAFTTASAQRVQADYALCIARAQLLRALGRP